jgi:hypothetical protein
MKNLLIKIASFGLFFIIGITFVFFFNQMESCPVMLQNYFNVESQNLLPNPPNLSNLENKQRHCKPLDSSDFNRYENFSVEKLKNEYIRNVSRDNKNIIYGDSKSILTPKEWAENQRKIQIIERKARVLTFLIVKKEKKIQNLIYLEKCYK